MVGWRVMILDDHKEKPLSIFILVRGIKAAIVSRNAWQHLRCHRERAQCAGHGGRTRHLRQRYTT